ncbi:MAG: hypothetical protein M4579_004524 [Chaenotheca gracillima]|nr:MAG: hypothetical protein M4579_004524 [Chaenotheca gracillima]
MSGYRDRLKGGGERLKGGWQSRPTGLRDIKRVNQVAGLVGKGKESAPDPRDHQSAPLSSLRDPSSFAPPPRHVAQHGAAAGSSALTTDRSGLGAPLPEDAIQAQQEAEAVEQRRAIEPAPPPVPYRANTTGLSTDSLPKPPVRRPGQEAISSPTSSPMGQKKPSLPPRLPSRPSASNSPPPASPPPSYNQVTTDKGSGASWQPNQSAVSRLGRAGVSVPGLNIGSNAEPASAPSRAPQPSANGDNSQLNELQSRFSKMSSPSTGSASPSQGTSFAQKQAALKTASSFRNNPSSVSLSDARDAASTANNFRQRHGTEVSQGVKTANSFNQRFGVADRMNKMGNSAGASSPEAPPATPATPASPGPPASPQLSSVASKKPRPPPPPKKKFSSTPVDTSAPSSAAPPPIPLASKPKPN